MELLNRQNIRAIREKEIKKQIKKIFSCLDINGKKASFVFSDNSFIAELSKKYFNKNEATDVIAFPLADREDPAYLGEVVVSVEEAVNAAANLGLDWQRELLLYLVHGMLHLLGFEDKSAAGRQEMRKKEELILAQFKKVSFIDDK